QRDGAGRRAVVRAWLGRWLNRGSRYARVSSPSRRVVVVMVHPACRANASPRECTRSDRWAWRRWIQVMSARLRFGLERAVGVAGVDGVIARVPRRVGQGG